MTARWWTVGSDSPDAHGGTPGHTGGRSRGRGIPTRETPKGRPQAGVTSCRAVVLARSENSAHLTPRLAGASGRLVTSDRSDVLPAHVEDGDLRIEEGDVEQRDELTPVDPILSLRRLQRSRARQVALGAVEIVAPDGRTVRLDGLVGRMVRLADRTLGTPSATRFRPRRECRSTGRRRTRRARGRAPTRQADDPDRELAGRETGGGEA